ncbi:alpha-protein kinase 3 isoform X2 [Triplophysa dalaica]|uniref:alpha-protein kinase 3 isoform X2 n=1 Tax=Triplophysa dalaica TaxID=1582913 RepID=UPI0024DF94DB|nr:alpha-protein kinase 3 isoform X2 [Triplophysa dalaica]
MQTENMGSRRLMNRSLSGDGRYYYSGNDITSQNSTGGCRSYLNSVRPERRSTLCSVMAQLAEETQPTFESTLKSKAVSEATNVKFICMVSGHPAPDVTWYKDDVQLDRYCGLPKYEILRDGKTHRLNIYNCTLEDAAIYQASAQNSRGIVSCSGVLEVGTMNEYKIHQNYFAKLKQGNENCRREQKELCKAEKDNVPSSPDRTQRKRSSPMETTTSFGASSSSKEKEELNALSKTSAVEDRLSSPVQVPESTAVHFHSDSEMIPNVDKGNQGLTYIHDTMNTASIKQADSHAKKKIKKRVEMKETEMRSEKKTSTEKMEVQNTVIQNNVDITADTKQNEKPSMKASKCATDIKKTQVAHKPITSQRHPALKVTMETETKVVKETKQIKSPDNQKNLDRRSPLIKPHSKLQSQNIKHVQNQRVQNGTPCSPDNKLMDLDDSKSKLAAGPCVRILPHSCGKGDVNTDTGDRNVSVHSSRASAGGDSRIEPTETKNCGNIPSSSRKVAMECNEPPSLMHEVTSRFTDTLPLLGSHHLATQGQKEIAEDQSTVLTNNSTERHKPDLESTQLGEKNSTGHVSNSLQDGQVTIAMNSSMEEGTLTKISEKDYTDGNLMINRASDKPETKIKSVATSLNGTEVNKMGKNAEKKKVCISANVQGQKSNSKEKSMGSKHSVSLVTEFVQIHSNSNMSNPDVAQSQIMNDSSNFKALMKHTKALEFQEDSHVATENVSKMDIQEQGQSYTAKNETQQSFISKASTNDNDPEAAHIDSLPFLSQQHPKTFLSNLTIPAIYVTDVDCTSPNTETENIECSSPVMKSENVKFGAKPNVLNNNNAVSQKVNTSDHTDNITPESVGLPDAKVDLSLHLQSSASLNQPQQKALSQKNFIKTSGSQCSTERIASDFTGPVGRCIQLSNADKSKKANESDLAETKFSVLLAKTDSNLKPKSNYFIKQLKSAALDLELSNQRSTSVTLHDTPHRESEGKDKYRQTNSEVKQGESVLLQGRNNLNTVVCPLSPSSDLKIPLKTTDAQIITSSEPHKTEKRDLGKSNQKETYQEQILPLMPQPTSPLNLVNDAPSLEKNSPRLTRRAITDLAEINGNENVTTKSSDRDKENQFIVPQVIRKIRPEVFDTSGHLKLWCQFYNIVSDSTIRWFKDDVEIAEIKRSAGDETQLCLAIIQMSKRDCGVYRCSITNENGQNSTEYLLSTEISSMFLRQELQEVEEEIEMTPLIFSKGLADAGCWGSKFYGRVTTEEVQVGSGCKHKTRRLRVIYGLDPVFESRSSCLLKVRSPIAYESREETVLAEKNLQITKQDCRIQNMAREYVKIFATETREIESFGSALEIIPLYFMYRPASSVPYGTVEAELKGVFLRYCGLDHTGSLVYNNKSEVAQKCSSFQHWIHQWTSGNVLFSRIEGVDTILTNIEVVTKSKGHQGFPCEANPKVFEQFPTEHQCNYFCGLLNLKPPKLPEMLQTVRYRGYYSPQTQRKAPKSPKVSRRSNPQTST